jgi:hypothetical protein
LLIVKQFLVSLHLVAHYPSIPLTGIPSEQEPAMTDRRLLRRYLALVQRADELFAERGTAEAVAVPVEAEALLDELTMALAPIVSQFSGAKADPDEVRRLLAGWVH